MNVNAASKEIVQLIEIGQNDTLIEQKRLRNGDLLVRNAIGESLSLVNGLQIILRPGYFSLSFAGNVTVEQGKAGMTTLLFAGGDQLKFNDEGIQSLQRGVLLFQFVRRRKNDLLSAAGGDTENLFCQGSTPISHTA